MDIEEMLVNEDTENLYQEFLMRHESEFFDKVLSYVKGNQTKAAKVLGISRGTLRKKMAMYHLFTKRYKQIDFIHVRK